MSPMMLVMTRDQLVACDTRMEALTFVDSERPSDFDMFEVLSNDDIIIDQYRAVAECPCRDCARFDRFLSEPVLED